MIKILLRLNTEQFRESAIYYVGNFSLNILRYLFHLVLLRLLTPPEYGEFLSYLSLMYILAIPTGTIGILVTKYIAYFKGKEDFRSINNFFYYLAKKTLPVGIGVGTLLIFFRNPLAIAFKAHEIAFIVLGISTFVTVFQTIVSSFLSGFQKFITQTIIGFVNFTFTLGLAVMLIKLGLSASGAVLGQIISGILVTLITLYYIKEYIYPRAKLQKNINFSLKSFTFYSFLYNLGTMSLISVDILTARILFDTYTSGLYSSLSILGRMILFGLTPLISLALPMFSLRFSKKADTTSLFLKLGFSILLLGTIGSLVFTFIPKTMVSLLSGTQYISVSPFLSMFSFGMVAFALSQFILSYLMSIGREKANFLLLAVAVIQPIALFFLASNIHSYVVVNFYLQLILMSCLSIYLVKIYLTRIKFTHGQSK